MRRLFLAFALIAADVARAQDAAPRGHVDVGWNVANEFERQQILKQLHDVLFARELRGVLVERKVSYQADDGLEIPAYFFAPRDTSVPHPVVLMVHGGVHADFESGNAAFVRRLVEEGYVVVAPEYRGSTGYGEAFYDAIDYGGKEVDDVVTAIKWLAATVPYADTSRVGILGASHGGFIALHSVLRYPERFKAAVAQVPVADLPTRIRTHPEAYHEIFARQSGFGGRLEDHWQRYWDRSPIAHVRELKTPTLVQTATNDEDVYIVENHNMRDSMVAAGKDREGLYIYHEWKDPPGGHSFAYWDTPAGRDAWREAVAFLNRYLKPAKR